MFDLIEHVISPVELIKSAKKMLKPDGIILVFTPQYDSVAIQEMKEYSNLIMPAEHLSYFTKTTVEKLTELTNMELVYYVTKGIDIGDLKSFYDYRMDVEKATVMNKMYDVLQPSIDQAGTGNHMRFIIKGNES
jgi:2-polyprenyl-3-methyl-5-hydroxy-6-metoxy-1,4-benzoquinol methylase